MNPFESVFAAFDDIARPVREADRVFNPPWAAVFVEKGTTDDR